jgi:hypothetical protein
LGFGQDKGQILDYHLHPRADPYMMFGTDWNDFDGAVLKHQVVENAINANID